MATTHTVDLGLFDRLDYMFDWTDWLVPGDTIDTSAWILPPGIEQIHASWKNDHSTIVWIRVAPGYNVGTYELSNQILTTGNDAAESNPRLTDRTLIVNVVEY